MGVDYSAARLESSTGPDGVEPGRARAAVRELYERPGLVVRDLTAPLLVLPDDRDPTDLPGVVTLRQVGQTVRRWSGLGIRGVKVFAYGTARDARASGATAAGNLMCLAVEEAKAAAPEVVVTTEVCGCSWTDHDECTILDGRGRIVPTATFDLMGRMAVLHALAGADVVSPTAMPAGSVRAVRDALTEAGFRRSGCARTSRCTPGLYGPFKQVMGTDPGRGHRRGLQLEPGRAGPTRLPVRQQSTKIRCPNREPRCAVLPRRDSVVHSQPQPPRRPHPHPPQPAQVAVAAPRPGRQALLALAHLRNGDTLTRLACGFEIGVTTAWRYVRDAIDLLAATADYLDTAMHRIRLLAYVILDGTLIPIDRVADQKPSYYSGKHCRQGMNVQVIADAAGRLVWASAALPGAVHDLTAARAHAIIESLSSEKVMTFADKAYQGARGSIRTPFKRDRYRPELSAWQKKANRAHARIRAIGERANATLKSWKILTKLRCSPHRQPLIVQAILVLHHVENPAYSG